MIVERFTTSACCGRTSITFKLNEPLTTNHLSTFTQNGFIESSNFTNAGILYISNQDLIATGPFGSNRLQIKCKNNNCNEKVNDFENLLKNM